MTIITRKVVKTISKYNKIYEYYTSGGKKITDKESLDYIKSLKIPPAYENVKIDMNRNAKLLVVGYDVKGKKQYMYSSKWVEQRTQKKFCNMIEFGKKLGIITKDIDAAIKEREFTKEKLIAIILKIIMICHFRIGNTIGKDVYDSYGVSTINRSHIKNAGKNVVIEFVGKKGVINICKVVNPDMIRILNELRDRTKNNKDQIFYYFDKATKKKINVSSCDVNNFLKKYGNFSSKDFRTWFANMYFIDEVISFGNIPVSLTDRKKYANLAIEKAANSLHHTVAISKKKYINMNLIEMYIESPTKFKNIIVKNYKINGKLNPASNAFIEYLKKYC